MLLHWGPHLVSGAGVLSSWPLHPWNVRQSGLGPHEAGDALGSCRWACFPYRFRDIACCLLGMLLVTVHVSGSVFVLRSSSCCVSSAAACLHALVHCACLRFSWCMEVFGPVSQLMSRSRSACIIRSMAPRGAPPGQNTRRGSVVCFGGHLD